MKITRRKPINLPADALELAARGLMPIRDVTLAEAKRRYHHGEPMPITDDRIEQFRREAAEAGDLEAVALCQRALNQLDSWEDTPRSQRIDDEAAVTRALAMSIEDARAAVAEWCADAEAMRD